MEKVYLVAFVLLGFTLAMIFAFTSPNMLGVGGLLAVWLLSAAWFISLIGMMIEDKRGERSC